MLEEENVSYDFSISSSIQPIAGANSVPLFEEDMVLAVSENHPFAGRTISFAHLREPALKNTIWLSWPKNVPLSDMHRKFKRFAMHELAGMISP